MALATPAGGEGAQPPPAQSAATTGEPARTDLLTRRDVPPLGVEAQLDFFGGGGLSWCGQEHENDGPLTLELKISQPPYMPGDFIFFCHQGFGDALPEMTITTPTGNRLPLSSAEYLFRVPADFVPGDYALTAALGDRNVSVRFEVVAVQSPRGLVEPSFGAPGTIFNVILLGLAPGQVADLHLYRLRVSEEQTSLNWDYVTALPAIEADGGGRAALELPSLPDGPVGPFRVGALPEIEMVSSSIFQNSTFIIQGPFEDQFVVQGDTLKANLPGTELWAGPDSGEQVYERPWLYAGATVTVIELRMKWAMVHTPEGVEGWVRGLPGTMLAHVPTFEEESALYSAGARVVVTSPSGVPLRDNPRSTAAVLREQLPPALEATVEDLKGDWVFLRLPDGEGGWARWYYDGVRYIEPSTAKRR